MDGSFVGYQVMLSGYQLPEEPKKGIGISLYLRKAFAPTITGLAYLVFNSLLRYCGYDRIYLDNTTLFVQKNNSKMSAVS